jgi:hypothetical protein
MVQESINKSKITINMVAHDEGEAFTMMHRPSANKLTGEIPARLVELRLKGTGGKMPASGYT